MKKHALSGVYAASITPMNSDTSPALDEIPGYLNFLAQRGCHGALMLGTTGEGPSFETRERLAIFKASTEIREEYPDFQLLAGTGTPSLDETIYLTKSAFDLGFDGVVVLPPYYFHQATDDGLYAWFKALINRGSPRDGKILGYHFPAQSKVPLSRNLLIQLRDSFPDQFVGIKDSSSNAEYANPVNENMDEDFVVLVGNDRYLSRALDAGSAGCITAMANLFSPSLRSVWDAYQIGDETSAAQSFINDKRAVLEKYPPYGPSVKALIAQIYDFPLWPVRPPLLPLDTEQAQLAASALSSQKCQGR